MCRARTHWHFTVDSEVDEFEVIIDLSHRLPDHSVDDWLANSARHVSARRFAATIDEIQRGCKLICAPYRKLGALVAYCA